MTIGLSPVVLVFGPYAVRWFGLLTAMGIGIGLTLTLRAVRQQDMRPQPVLDAVAWALPIGFVFARVFHVIGWWDYYLTHASDILQLNLEDGLSLWGGLVAGGVVAAARLVRDPARRRRIFDAAAPGLAMGIAIGRLGEFLDGAGQGIAADLPWATRYTNPLAATPDFGVNRQPVQLYDMLICVVLFGVLQKLPASWRMATFLVTYGLARVLLGQLRLDPAFLFGVQLEQVLAASCAVFGLGLALGVARRSKIQQIAARVHRRRELAA